MKEDFDVLLDGTDRRKESGLDGLVRLLAV